MKVPSQKSETIFIAVISVGFVIWSAAFIWTSSFIAIDGKRYFCLFDDAMISMRYAWNFSHGLGLVWNQEEHIQGYTNLLMTLIMSVPAFISDKSTAVLLIQILGMIFMLAIAYVSMKIANHIIPSKNQQHQSFIRVLSFLCALSYYPLNYWSLMGMETGLLTLLLLLGILYAFDYTRSENTVCVLWMSIFLGLTFLTRNESIIFTALVYIYLIWDASIFTVKVNRKDILPLFVGIGLYFLFIIGQFIFQYLSYGEFLPNTYTLKLTGMSLFARLSNGFGFIQPFLIEIAPILIVAVMDLFFAFRKKKLLLLSVAISAIAYQVYVGGDPWNYWRIMSPSIPLIWILFISSINTMVLAVSSTQAFGIYFLRNPIFSRKYITEILVLSLALIGLLLANKRFWSEISLSEPPYTVVANRINVNTAIALTQVTTSNATIGVYWAGSIPYFTDRRAIDFLGKSDRYIAHLPPDISGSIASYGMTSVPGHNKYDLNYSIKTFKPTYVQGFRHGTQDLSQWAQTEYTIVEYVGVRLALLTNSSTVLWDKVTIPALQELP